MQNTIASTNNHARLIAEATAINPAAKVEIDTRSRTLFSQAGNGEIIWVVRPDGADFFCQSLINGDKLHYAQQWLDVVTALDGARIIWGHVGGRGGLIRTINRAQAIAKMAQW